MIKQQFNNYLKFSVPVKLCFRLFIFWSVFFIPAHSAKCLYVSSYHEQYEWDSGIRKGMEPILSGHCDLHKFFMDTKRNKNKLFAQKKAQQALALINQYQPDVIIAADDNASRYLVEPYLKDSKFPVVFCGINNSASLYGYPYKNATGMVEITPVLPLLKAIKETLPDVKRGIFLSADVLSQRRMFERLRKSFAKENIQIEGHFVSTQNEWESAWKAASDRDYIFIGNPAGITEWDTQRVHRLVIKQRDVFTVTVWDWLAPLAMLTVTKIPEEQGEWAAKVTLEILKGTPPDKIPVVVNRRWKMYRNTSLLNYADIKLPIGIAHNAQEITP